MHVMHYGFPVGSDAFGNEHRIYIVTCCKWLGICDSTYMLHELDHPIVVRYIPKSLLNFFNTPGLRKKTTRRQMFLGKLRLALSLEILEGYTSPRQSGSA